MTKTEMKDAIIESYYAGDFTDSKIFEMFISDLLNMIDLDSVNQIQLKTFTENWCDLIPTE